MPIPSPFHTRTAPLSLNQEWRNWAGYLAAATYENSHEREYFAIRNSVAIIDVSPLYKYEISGQGALRAVNRIMTRDFERCPVGQVRYTPWCDDDGKVLDDGTVARLAGDRFRITAAEANLAWFQDCTFGLDAEVQDVSERLASLAVQGPFARQLLKEVVRGIDLDSLKYYHLAEGTLNRVSLTISRTGYTGDLGYELWFAPEFALEIWDVLMERGQRFGILPAGMVALDIARIEAGLIMLQVDYISARKALIEVQKSSPYELGLGWAVNLEKPTFVGRQALLAEHKRGSPWSLAGLEIDWLSMESEFARVDLVPQVAGRASRSAVPVYQGDRQVGQATSLAFSPILKKYISIATLESPSADPGTPVEVELTVEYVRRRAAARVAKLPFFNPARKRSLESASSSA
jgi:glycine cleavage system T protein (aminomethyltransferase)